MSACPCGAASGRNSKSFFIFCFTAGIKFLEKNSMKQQKIAREGEKQESTKKGFTPLFSKIKP